MTKITDQDKKRNKELDNSEVTPTPVGESLWKLPEDDEIDVNEVFNCPMIPGTSGVEC